jgi:glycosyltransferase involved in cell wall biosynthesis
VSFVVIAFNEERHVMETLASIRAQHGLHDGHEVVVVDDASTDRTAEIVERCAEDDPAVRLIRLRVNGGRGHARSVATAAARGRYVATIDADIVLPPDWLARCRAAMTDADAVGGIAVPDGDVCFLYRQFHLEPRPVMHTAALTGNNALYDRKVFDAVGFDADLRNGEDVALGHDMQAAGIRTKTLEGLYVRHEEHKSLAQSVSWLFESGVGASGQLRRYRRVRAPDLAFAGWLGTLATGAILRRRGRRKGLLLLPGYLLAVAAAHVSGRFQLSPRRPARAAGAIGVDALMLGAYFVGRVVGHLRRV